MTTNKCWKKQAFYINQSTKPQEYYSHTISGSIIQNTITWDSKLQICFKIDNKEEIRDCNEQ